MITQITNRPRKRGSSSGLVCTKEFTDDPVAPGDPVTLELTLTNTHPTWNATEIEFEDVLDASLSGLTLTSVSEAPPDGDPDCGTFGGVGTSTFEFSDGALDAGATCIITLTLTVPGDALPGSYPNTTTGVTGTIAELAVTGEPASDDLEISFLSFTKAFDGPVVAGDTAVLTFTIENLDSSSAFPLAFFDDLDGVLLGLEATGLSIERCLRPGLDARGRLVPQSHRRHSGRAGFVYFRGDVGGTGDCDGRVVPQRHQ